MIDQIQSCDERNITTTFEIKSDNLFLTEDQFSESGMLENIAQSAAAKVGYECEKKQIPVPLGFIGGISKIRINRFAKIGDNICTEINVEREVFGVTIVKGRCFLADELLAECEMKIIIENISS